MVAILNKSTDDRCRTDESTMVIEKHKLMLHRVDILSGRKAEVTLVVGSPTTVIRNTGPEGCDLLDTQLVTVEPGPESMSSDS